MANESVCVYVSASAGSSKTIFIITTSGVQIVLFQAVHSLF